MKTERLPVTICLALILAAGLLAAPQQQKAKAKKKDKPALQSLIRRDLLQLEAEALQPPLRNIFAPLRPGSRPDRPGGQGGGIEDDHSEEETAGQDAGAEDTLPAAYDLRYIGYIRSTERTVAVIIFEGEPLAVKPGDLISEGVTIMKITPEEIVFQGPDAVSRAVSLEGEDR